MSRKLALGLALVAPSVASAETFNIRARIFCPENSAYCSANNFEQLRTDWRRSVAEINLEYQPTGFSFRPLDPIITVDNRLASLTSGSGTSSTGHSNEAIKEELIDLAAGSPGEITLLLVNDPDKCWNGIPCPSSGQAFDGDDVVFCGLPQGNAGRTYAHELGHFWCLRHPFTGADGPNLTPAHHDHDVTACPELGVVVDDTPPDPLRRESGEATTDNIPDYRYFCDATADSGVDAGSPHASMCDVQCFMHLANQDLELDNYTPMTENLMSYYSAGNCRGPYVVGGDRVEAMTDGQVDVIHACRDVMDLRSDLSDYCAGRGGDSDRDGWCNNEDVCRFVANTDLANADGDAFPDACDLCPNTAGASNADLDGDGLGDVCDSDDDNDGCSDATDQHPTQASVPVGTEFRPLCNPEHGTIYGFEGDDTDGDGLANCRDTDDDNDGLLDSADRCPTSAAASCHRIGAPCGEQGIWSRFICRFGGCNELLVKLVDAVNPDPTRVLTFDRFSVVNDVLYLDARAGETLGESAMRILRGVGRRVQVQVVNRSTGRLVARLFDFDADAVRLGDVSRGTLLALSPPMNGARPALAAVWGEGAVTVRSLVDADRDRIPDHADNCTRRSNLSQLDADRDGYGDACDADFGQNNRVDLAEVQRVEQCAGADLARDVLLSDMRVLTAADRQVRTRQLSCEATDLNADRRVDASDAAIARALLNARPGPSAFR